MKLILLRHGQTPSNVAGLLDTAPPGPGLTDLGQRQAIAAAEVLATEEIDAVFASNQLRAQQTASPLATHRDLEIGVLPGLREIAAGDLEMKGDADSVHRYIGILMGWVEGDLERRIPGGPNGLDVLARYDQAIEQVVDSVGGAGSAVAVSHGAAIRLWAASRIDGLPSDGGSGQHLENTGAVIVERGSGGRWELVDWRVRPLGTIVDARAAESLDDAGPTA